ncbi:cytochrome P450 [Desmospora profundinema]|uniref:Cytochrome P450 n=1 Tax=Desmospora profundinema TaxID=1571184 RepID=A0ABU1IH26_9BACL|nr:cytochrome P450 [Desmospora profundinema]MDR6224085.1 cytochrome P450 [Desmospora profundinema]
MDTSVRSMIERKRSQPSATDVLAALVQARDEDGAVLSDDELIGHTFTLFVAGHETTSNALTWTIFLLSQHPDILADLLDELDGALQGASPTMEKLNQLPLLEGVVKESLRLLPPASIGMRITGSPCVLGGFFLPKGSNIFYSPFVTHRLPELYPEPNRFHPKRWAGLKRSPYEFLPFGAGPHMCMGWAFAMQEMKVVLAMLLQRYRLFVVDHTKIEPNLNMRPKYGMPMRIFPQGRQFQRGTVRGAIHQLVDFNE